MNLRGNGRLRMLLMGALAAGVLGPQVVRSAGPAPVASNRTPAATRPAMTPPQLLPATTESAVIPVAGKGELAPSAAGNKSEVMKQLELLYQQDGREMPEMNTEIRPVPVGDATGGAGAPGARPAATAAPTAAAPVAAAAPAAAAGPNGLRMQQPVAAQSMAAQPAAPQPVPSMAQPENKSKNPVIAFFKKLVPGQKDAKPTKAPAEYRSDVPPVPPAAIAGPVITSRPVEQPPALATTTVALPALDSQPRALVVVPEPARDPLPNPMADFADIPPAPTGDAPPVVREAFLPPLFTKPMPAAPEKLPDSPATNGVPANEPTNPFTEGSEADTDKKLDINPFTGLTLDEKPAALTPPGNANPPAQTIPDVVPPSALDPADPFAEELIRLGINTAAPEAGKPSRLETPSTPAIQAPAAQQPAAQAPGAQTPTFEGIEDEATREKMKKIHERGSMKGLKGFCPVTLRNQRELIDAKADFHSTYRGQKFHFADAEAKVKFDEDAARFAPAAYGADVVALTRDKDVVEGSLDFAAWYKGRLYLFGSQDTHDTFVANPSQFATPAGIE